MRNACHLKAQCFLCVSPNLSYGTPCRYDLTSFQSGLVVSSSLFGALAGSAAAFVVGDPLGRKRELLLAAALYSEPHTEHLHHRLRALPLIKTVLSTAD